MLSKKFATHRIKIIIKNYRCYSNFAYTHHPTTTPLIYKNLGQQIEIAAKKYGSQIAIKSNYDKKQLSFEESYTAGVNLASKLQQIGLQPGDHVAIWAPNTIQWYTTFLASAIGGFPLVCINPALQVPELEFAVKKAKVKCLITMDSYEKLDFLNKIKRLYGNQKTLFPIIIKSEKNIENFLNYGDLLDQKCEQMSLNEVLLKMHEIPPESPSAIQFTSGTTGQPKAALLSHFNMVNEAVYMGRALKLHTREKSLCLPIPMFHAFGLSIIISSFHYGSTVCLPSPIFNASAALETIERDECNILVGTPTMFVDMVDTQSKIQKSFKSLETALVGASACSPEMLQQTKDVLQLSHMQICYGMTEATAAVFAQDGSEATESALYSVGKIFEHGEAKVVDESGNTLKFGEVGELCMRGWFTMLGYMDDEENTRKTKDAKGWLRTGDLFLLESNGEARFQGRKKDIIIRGGENIFPKEIEDVLNQHESILESHVVGVPDYRLGEEVCVYMRLKQNAKSLTQADVKQFCEGKLAYFKVPKHVRIVEEFPKTASGKIQKFKLQQLYATEVR